MGANKLIAALAGLTAASQSEDAEASFVGPLAKNWDKVAHALAVKMRDAKVPREEIWRKTGIDLDNVDGVPRMEIDDSGMSFDMLEDLPAATHEPRGAIGDVLQHDELYAAHPDLADIRATQTDGRGGQFTSNDGFGNQRAAYANESSGMHEIQHGIQEREGFAPGGNPDMAGIESGVPRNPVLDAATKYIKWRNTSGPERAMSMLLKKYDQPVVDAGVKLADSSNPTDLFLEKSQEGRLRAFEGYKRLAGEAEARNVQTRLNMTPQERRAAPPWETVDVPESEQIVRMKGMADPALLSAIAASAGAAATGVGNASEFAFNALEMPTRGLHGMAALLGSLAEGKRWEDAAIRGGTVAQQPLDQTAGELGQYTADKTGSAHLAALVDAITRVAALEP